MADNISKMKFKYLSFPFTKLTSLSYIVLNEDSNSLKSGRKSGFSFQHAETKSNLKQEVFYNSLHLK